MSPRDQETLPVVRAADLDEPDPARRWLIEPLWMQGGVGTIGGLPKSCKSWLGLDVAVSVASGTPCLDTFPVRDPGNVLLYMAEDAAPLVKARLWGLCRHRGLALQGLPLGVITALRVRLDLRPDQRRLAETVRQEKPRLLVLDPFVRWHQVNENQAGEVAAILGYLRVLQRTYNLAVLIIHHACQNGSSTGGLSPRGSGDFFAWVDTALSLRLRPQTLALRHAVLEQLPLLLNFDMDSSHYLTLLLVGQPLLRRTLSLAIHEALRQRIAVHFHLEGITRQELDAYLAHQLKAAGLSQPLFEDSAVQALYLATKGLLRKVNKLALAALRLAAERQSSRVTEALLLDAAPEVL